MASSVNKIFLIGNLGNEPQISTLSNGKIVAKISVATTESWKDASGTRQERTEWHQVVFFDGLAEIASKYLQKGAKVFVGGSLRTEKYIDKNGIERSAVKVIGRELTMLSYNQNDKPTQNDSKDHQSGFHDDDIPF